MELAWNLKADPGSTLYYAERGRFSFLAYNKSPSVVWEVTVKYHSTMIVGRYSYVGNDMDSILKRLESDVIPRMLKHLEQLVIRDFQNMTFRFPEQS